MLNVSVSDSYDVCVVVRCNETRLRWFKLSSRWGRGPVDGFSARDGMQRSSTALQLTIGKAYLKYLDRLVDAKRSQEDKS